MPLNYTDVSSHLVNNLQLSGRGGRGLPESPRVEPLSLEQELAQVREHRDALLALIEAAPIAFITLDAEGSVQTWNAHAERIFGWSPQEALGQRVPFVAAEHLGEFLSRHQAQLYSDRPVHELEVRRARKDGSQVDVSVSTSLIHEDGKVRFIIGALADITQRKEAQRQLQELNQTLESRVAERTAELQQAVSDLESFSYSVSHDLRSPLRAIAGYAQVLEEDFAEALGDEGLGYLQRIFKGTQRMSRLIDDLLQFAKTTRQPLHRQEVCMQTLVRECLEELQICYHLAQVEVGELPVVQGDPGLLRQVWANLLSNALKYSSHAQPSRVWVSAHETAEDFCFEVKDNGVGFDMRHAANLFKVFQRLHRAEEFEGTGVGLAIVARVVQRHGGNIGADSQPGQGSRFTFSLPRQPANG